MSTDTDVESFPDVPPANRPGGGDGQRSEHDVDLDAFADRLGVGQLDTEGEDEHSTANTDRSARLVADTMTAAVTRTSTGALGAASGLLHGVASLMGSASNRLDRIADRLDVRRPGSKLIRP